MVLSVPAYSGTKVRYTWTMPSGVRVTGQNSNVIRIQGAEAALHDGDYRVEVRVNDCILTSAVYTLTSLPWPTAAPRFTVTAPCDGGGLSLFSEATGVQPLSFAWTGPNGFRSADAAGFDASRPTRQRPLHPRGDERQRLSDDGDLGRDGPIGSG